MNANKALSCQISMLAETRSEGLGLWLPINSNENEFLPKKDKVLKSVINSDSCL
jgi:hypothetical protein